MSWWRAASWALRPRVVTDQRVLPTVGPVPGAAAYPARAGRPLFAGGMARSRTVGDDINTMSFTTLLSAQIAEW